MKMSKLFNLSPNVRKSLTAGVVFIGCLSVVKTFQDLRYRKKDMKNLSNTQISERELEAYGQKYKLSDKEMKQILAAAKERRQALVQNEYENNPHFEHKRVPGRDDD
ncbi:hypothetical protein ACF0H5_003050 [Mactra antiquata]